MRDTRRNIPMLLGVLSSCFPNIPEMRNSLSVDTKKDKKSFVKPVNIRMTEEQRKWNEALEEKKEAKRLARKHG